MANKPTEHDVDVDKYAVHTGQEIDVLERSACDGYTGQNWTTITAMEKRVYELQDASHYVELTLTDDEAVGSLTLAALERLTFAQDADFAFTMLYICSAIAPPAPLPDNRAAVEWIDLDDVMEKIGWYPDKRTAAERETLREKVWQYVVYGHKAAVIGSRTTTYHDKRTGENIETRIESPIWQIMSKERPTQATLFDEVPRRIQVVISKQWEPLLTMPNLAQYLPLGELLGAIPPNKVSGDWARAIGLALASLWRRNPREVMVGAIQPTRRELMTRYTPKKRTVNDFLSNENKNPRRDVAYWHDALKILVDRGLIAPEGEPSRSIDDLLAEHAGYEWREKWLNSHIDLRPGTKWQGPVKERADALPPFRPWRLGQKRRRPNKKS